MRFIDLTGKRFGYMTAKKVLSTKNGSTVWLMVCDCGKELSLRTVSFKRKHKPQLGCMECARKRQLVHGMSKSKEFFAWRGILSRCTCKTDEYYHNYGGRGITVCDRWLEFKNFLDDMGYAPSKKHSIDRVDNNKGYYKENCRWATSKQQMRNVRSNRYFELNGVRKLAVEWAESLDMPESYIYNRLARGWSLERALTEKVKPRLKK